MTGTSAGPVSLELAYEHLFTYTEHPGASLLGALFAAVAPGGGEWLELQWTARETSRLFWRHRFDRLSVAFAPGERWAVTVGRQAISWATTLVLTPADPFVPFDPSDPFREYRAGVDALRVQAFPGPFSSVEAVVRPSKTPEGETLTLLGRARGLVAGWELSGWAGMWHDEFGVGAGATGALGRAALRGEASVRAQRGDLVARFSLGVDTRLTALGRDLYAVGEYQRDGFGAARPEDLPRAFASEPAARGELQVFGRDVVAVRTSYSLHPLWTGGLLALWNLDDGSALLSPEISYSAADEVAARAGLFLGLGPGGLTAGGGPRSEFGAVPAIGYLSLSVFF